MKLTDMLGRCSERKSTSMDMEGKADSYKWWTFKLILNLTTTPSILVCFETDVFRI